MRDREITLQKSLGIKFGKTIDKKVEKTFGRSGRTMRLF